VAQQPLALFDQILLTGKMAVSSADANAAGSKHADLWSHN